MSVSSLAKPEFGQFTAIPVSTQWDRESGRSPGLQPWPRNSDSQMPLGGSHRNRPRGGGGAADSKCPGRTGRAEVTRWPHREAVSPKGSLADPSAPRVSHRMRTPTGSRQLSALRVGRRGPFCECTFLPPSLPAPRLLPRSWWLFSPCQQRPIPLSATSGHTQPVRGFGTSSTHPF